MSEDSKKSHRCPDGTFRNPHIASDALARFSDIIRWQFGLIDESDAIVKVPEGFSYPSPKEKIDENAPTVTWINHSTALVQLPGLTVLTDPVWSQRSSPVQWAGPIRHHPAGVPFKSLPVIDLVLISHNHYDHLDLRTIRNLSGRPTFFVPLGLKNWFESVGVRKVEEKDWWETSEFASGVRVTAVPTQHFSGRGLRDRNHSLWAGWVLEYKRDGLERKVFFAGDTGYNPFDFKAVHEHFGPVDLALIPIGAYLPRKIMKPVHLNPAEAIQVHKELEAKVSVGIHWNTFKLTDETREQPAYEIYVAAKRARVDLSRFRVLKPGQKINW